MVCSKIVGSKTKVFPRHFGIQMKFFFPAPNPVRINTGTACTERLQNLLILLPQEMLSVHFMFHVNSILSHYPFSILNKIFLPIGRKLRKNESHIPCLYMLWKVNLASLLIVFYKQSCLHRTTKII